jgi:hypothetical protein
MFERGRNFGEGLTPLSGTPLHYLKRECVARAPIKSGLSISLPSPAKIFCSLPAKTGWRGDIGVRYNMRYKSKKKM